MATRRFEGFGELAIIASELGQRHDPCVIILPGAGQPRSDWSGIAEALAQAGRYVIVPDLRGQGDSEAAGDGGYDVAAYVGDLNAILRDLPSRPVVIGAGMGAYIAATALGEGAPHLAAGIALIEGEGEALAPTELMERAMGSAGDLNLPALHVRSAENGRISALAERIPSIETGSLPADEPADGALAAALIEFLERRVPRSPTEYVAGSDPRTLRDALGTFATGVTVVTTTDSDGTPVGLTANSFTSVSLDPPLLLVCPARDAASMAVLSKTEHFAVNVLHIGQQTTSNLFASRGADRFGSIECETWDHGVPIIRNSLANFECRKYAEYDGGDHVILVGEVLRVRFAPQRDPLLYFRGKYRSLHFV